MVTLGREASGGRILPMGDRALLLEVGSLDDVLDLRDRLEASRPDGIVDLVPGARTVLVRVDPAVLSLGAAQAWVAGAKTDAASAAAASGPLVELDVVYDGADLAETAVLLGVSADELVRRHAAAEWTVAFTGFAPGFAYLVSHEWTFEVPRLASPRTRVPAGSVGLAGVFSGAYPRETPGGWRLIGTTSTPLWSPDAASPALLPPGARVRFRRAEKASPESGAVAPVETDAARSGIRVIQSGLLATIQDRGREGAASLGVSRSGALDRTALGVANRLVGNRDVAAGVEVTMGGFRAVAERDLWFAVTGAWGPVRLGGHEVDPYTALEWRAGEELHLDWFAHGARAYLAVRGGVDAPVVLGSRATDRLAGIGAAPLAAGSTVAVGDDVAGPIPVAPPAPWGTPHDDELEIELAPGPRADWFAPSALRALFDETWTVSSAADRVGMRLDGTELVRTRDGELPSEGMVPGALQVPPSGRPTILLADGPVTGGYPVIAVATDAALDLLAQARPGTRLRFRHARPPA
ncbi:5-oxoprolinase/urea amidolyase family protein [Microbacterium immunditiarum]|uniref:KipI family sensor histidine kinase inhibitor n=1 Tax=Microbacterium immunditiarum TaxID=337480 RepID=A0A7Y9GRL4_9MICO|nr:5-oxoprolinase/urea amidolyase family protein [Microbacterium immunditiarum]NYE21359.1 KipI family sensor histidine kinase inhibitor [Microbacterium immunditiarum]